VSTGADVRIVPVAPAHVPAIQALAADPRIAATTLMPSPYPPDGAARYVAESQAAWAEGTGYRFAVLVGDDLVGVCALKEVHDGQAELGYWIGVPFWGRGYATEAARHVTAFAFETLGLARLHAHALARNPSSGRVLEKAGFRFLDEVPNPFAKWAPTDRIRRYVLERPAWEANR
jgi:RimJ/RimL family protein N-acetyltransferase